MGQKISAKQLKTGEGRDSSCANALCCFIYKQQGDTTHLYGNSRFSDMAGACTLVTRYQTVNAGTFWILYILVYTLSRVKLRNASNYLVFLNNLILYVLFLFESRLMALLFSSIVINLTAGHGA